MSISMNLIVAQGSGFYGSAFMTTEKSVEEIKTAIKQIPNARDIGEYYEWRKDDALVVVGHDINTTNVTIIPDWKGNAQPKPVVLFCSGNSANDMEILKLIKEKLG